MKQTYNIDFLRSYRYNTDMPQTELLNNFLLDGDFGRGKFMGNDHRILKLNPQERVYVSAWRHACPEPDAVIKYYGNEWLNYWIKYEQQPGQELPSTEIIKEHGIAITRRRYDECDFVYGNIVEAARNYGKTDLLAALTGAIPRRNNEPVGYYEPGRVPESHETEISPLSRLVLFALPRLVIEVFGWGDSRKSWGDGNRTWERYEQGLKIVEQSVKHAKTPTHLLALVAKAALKAGVESQKILGHALEPGIEYEENDHTEFAEVNESLHRHVPELFLNKQ